MMDILYDIGVGYRDRKLIMNLYNKQSVFVRIGESLSESWQRSTTRLHTFALAINLYNEAIMRKALYEVECEF